VSHIGSPLASSSLSFAAPSRFGGGEKLVIPAPSVRGRSFAPLVKAANYMLAGLLIAASVRTLCVAASAHVGAWAAAAPSSISMIPTGMYALQAAIAKSRFSRVTSCASMLAIATTKPTPP
jgi:hypothetical protein